MSGGYNVDTVGMMGIYIYIYGIGIYTIPSTNVNPSYKNDSVLGV
jgi:hypothetical protein